jgi:hypothetical protein
LSGLPPCSRTRLIFKETRCRSSGGVLTLADLGASPEKVTVSGTLAADDAAGRHWLDECKMRGLQANVVVSAE